MLKILGRQVGACTHKIILVLIGVLFVHFSLYSQSFEDSFEKGIRDKYWAFEGHDNSTSTKYSLSGGKSYRAWLPAKKYTNARSEIRFRGGDGVPNFQPYFSSWGAKFAIYFPEDFKPDETSSEIIAQYHGVADDGDIFLSPPWALRLRGKTLSVTNRSTNQRNSTPQNVREKTWTLSEKIVPGKWHYFVVDIHWDYRLNGDGSMQFYMKVGAPPTTSNIKVNYSGPTGYNDKLGPYFKIGIYKWDWKHQSRVNISKQYGIKERVLYFDDVALKKNGFLTNSAPQVNQKPLASAGKDKEIFLDTQTEVTINGSGIDRDGTISKYRWNQISGPSDATTSNNNSAKITLSDLDVGLYIMRLTVTDDDGASDSDDVLITVSETSNTPPTANAGKNITMLLPNNSARLNGTATDPDPDDSITEYIWTQSDGPTDITISNPTNPSVEVKNLVEGRYVFKLKVYDESGALGSDHISIFVLSPDSQPIIDADITDAICNAANGSIVLNLNGGKSPYTYNWSNGSTKKDLINVPAGDYSVTITDSEGTKSTSNFSVDKQINQLKVTSTPINATCGNNDGSVELTVKGGKGPYRYEWNSDGTRADGFNNLAAGSYTVRVVDQNGCSKKHSFTIGIEPGVTKHQLDAVVNNASCAGNDGSISLAAKGNNGPYKFVWAHGASGPKLSDLEDGTYTVTVTDKHGCYMKRTFNINQDPGLAKPQIKQSGDSLYVTQQVAHYQWYKDSIAIENSNSKSIKIQHGGNYSVRIRNQLNCTASSDYFQANEPTFAATMNSNINLQAVEFYPNPVVDDVNVRIVVNQPATTSITIYDFQGRVIQSKHLGTIVKQATENIDVSAYPTGTYLIRASANDEIVTRRFIKH